MDDLQLNFGVIVNDGMGDAVKVTIIATGFAPAIAPDLREPAIEPKPASEFFADRNSEPAPPMPAPVAEPLIADAFQEPVFDEELDVPAYLRQGKLLN